MKAIFGSENGKFEKGSTAVGLGNFDGLHIGHMALINTLISESRMNGLESIIYTFTKHPENILRKKLFTPLLMTVGKKIQILSETALHYICFDEFHESYSRMKPESFVKDVLVGRLGARLLVAGFNYRFGFMGEGDVNLLHELGRKYNYKLIVIPPVKIDNEVVSSTRIRQHVTKGDMEGVFRLLGRHYSITGEVLDGKQIGRRIGFPTANLEPEKYLIMPHKGVYITRTLYDGKFFNSVTSIGVNPTFSDTDRISVETHILNFDRDIYRSSIEVFFLKKLRNELKFPNGEELSRQIQKDIQATRAYFDLKDE